MIGKDKYILFYSPQTLPSVGGLQYVVHYWAEALAQQGYRVVVASQTEGSVAAASGAGYQTVQPASGWALRGLFRKATCILMFNVSLKALPWWLGCGTPLFISHQTSLWYEHEAMPFRQKIKRWVANHVAKGHIACSAYIARQYNICKVVYNPIRTDVFCLPAAVSRLPVIFFAGRFVSDKGVDLLLAAFAQLHRLQPDTPWQLCVAGDGPDKDALQLQATRLGIAHRVQWPGMLPQPALVQHMQQCRVMVVPSRMEPMGMVVAEGLATGCTMVVARQGGLPEVGGAFCHYFQPGSIPDLTRALHEALTQPLQPNPVALQQHLQQFTVGYSVERVLTMLKC